MNYLYRIHKIFQIKKELKEVYTNQAIEALALSIIGIFIPAYLIDTGFAFREVILFLIVNYFFALVARPPSAKINSMIGLKHTILIRAPIFIAFLAMITGVGAFPQLFYPAAALGGISLALYYTSITTEYVKVCDRRREGEEAGLLFGLPHISAVVGPLVGAFILTFFGFATLFLMAVALVFSSVVPLFLSSDYKGGGFRTRGFGLLLDVKRAAYYFAEGAIIITDFAFWGLYVFLNYGFVSLGVAASLMGLGMLLFTLVVGRLSNTISGSRNIVRASGLFLAALWVMRALASTELEFMALSFFGGFIITSLRVSIFSDFTRFARKNGPSRSVVFRHSWIEIGRFVPMALLLLLFPGLGALQFIRATFIVAALLSLILVSFKE